MNEDDLPWEKRNIDGTDLSPEEIKLYTTIANLPNVHLMYERFIRIREGCKNNGMNPDITENHRHVFIGMHSSTVQIQNLIAQFEALSVQEAVEFVATGDYPKDYPFIGETHGEKE